MGALFCNDIKTLLKRRKIFLFLLFLLCFAGAVRWGVNRTEDVHREGERVSIGVINYDTSIYSRMLINFYQENGIFTSYVSVYIEEDEVIRNMFENGELDMYLVIPEDFADSMVYLEHRPVEAVISSRNTATQILLQNLMEGYRQYISAVEINCVALYDIMLDSGMTRQEASGINERISVQLIMQALARDDFFERNTVKDYTSVKLVPYYIHEFFFLILAYLALMTGVRFQKEHHAGILRRLVSMGSSVFGILLEKQLFFSLLLTAGLFLIRGIMAAFGISIRFAAVCFACLTGYFLCAVMLFLAALFQKMQNYLLASNMYLLLGAILGGGLIPFMYLPDGMLALARLMPDFWFLKIMFLIEDGRMPEHAGLLAAVLIAAVFAVLALASFAYRGKEGRVYENA